MNKLKFQELKQKEIALKKVKHEDFDVQIIISDMFNLAFEIPRWKFWAYAPIVNYIYTIEQRHKACCGLSLE